MLGTQKTGNLIHFHDRASQLNAYELRVYYEGEESKLLGLPLIRDEPRPVCGPN